MALITYGRQQDGMLSCQASCCSRFTLPTGMFLVHEAASKLEPGNSSNSFTWAKARPEYHWQQEREASCCTEVYSKGKTHQCSRVARAQSDPQCGVSFGDGPQRSCGPAPCLQSPAPLHSAISTPKHSSQKRLWFSAKDLPWEAINSCLQNGIFFASF